MKISEYCKNLRLAKGLSVSAFARINDVSHTYILDIEQGKKDKPSALILSKLIKVYHFTPEDLSKLDLCTSIIDGATDLAFSHLPHPHLKDGSLNKSVFDYINFYLVPRGYTITDQPFLDYKKTKRIDQTFDSEGYINPVYDVKGLTPDGGLFFFFALSSALRSMSEKDYYKFVYNQMTPIIDSIEYSSLKKENIKIEIIFFTLSKTVNNIANKVLKTLASRRAAIRIEHFNIKIPSKKTESITHHLEPDGS